MNGEQMIGRVVELSPEPVCALAQPCKRDELAELLTDAGKTCHFDLWSNWDEKTFGCELIRRSDTVRVTAQGQTLIEAVRYAMDIMRGTKP